MSGLQQFALACIALALLAAAVALIVRKGVGGRVSLSLANIFDVEVEIEAPDADAARRATRIAAETRGGRTGGTPAGAAPGGAGSRIDTVRNVRLARVLWVDDHPDGNLYETVALEELGLLVTKATTTGAALAYLSSGLSFSLVISDVTRHGDPDAGPGLLRSVREGGPDIPVIFYTLDAGSRAAALLEAGASAVVETPGELVDAVLARRPAPDRHSADTDLPVKGR
ncbi:response regulator [Actinomadura roseirufa]|uniref:response regulator n=1 Tax=Actinomadura roseirufa TaxID=2094049 RepID=UPI00104139A6|nr:response regulator [Actinomadura roseirufa]